MLTSEYYLGKEYSLMKMYLKPELNYKDLSNILVA